MDINQPHRRRNALTGEWVLVSPQRTHRPWLGQTEAEHTDPLPAYDPGCYLCPGNERAGGVRNPRYDSTYVFDNDFAAMIPLEAEPDSDKADRLFQIIPETGKCQVVCFSPRHDLNLPDLPQEAVEAVVRTWATQTAELEAQPGIGYVQVFENKGAVMGASNPHPHSQIWASGHIPNEPFKEHLNQEQYFGEHGSCLLCDYLADEESCSERIVAANEEFIAVVPFWAVWPFEVLVAGRRHCKSLAELDEAGVSGLADMLRRVTCAYDRLFNTSFPYSMGFHGAPVGFKAYPGWHLHAHFYPPLLRSASIKKFMVGYELLAMPQRDITPEDAAARLREAAR